MIDNAGPAGFHPWSQNIKSPFDACEKGFKEQNHLPVWLCMTGLGDAVESYADAESTTSTGGHWGDVARKRALYEDVADSKLNLSAPALPSILGVTPWDDDEPETRRFAANEFLSEEQSGKDRAVLVRVGGSMNGQVRMLQGQEIVIGRHKSSGWQVYDLGVSRRHAKITTTRTGYVIEDLDSSNGTYVEGRRIRRSALNDGDIVQFGPLVRFRFSVVDQIGEQSMLQLFEGQAADPLTGGINRRYLSKCLDRELSYAMRHNTSLSIVLVDMATFQARCDAARNAGVETVRSLFSAVREELREEDLLCRYSGDQFAILLRGEGIVGARRVAERVRERVARVTFDGSDSVRLVMCAGIASLSCLSKVNKRALWDRADDRLRLAKKRGNAEIVAAD